ncbi:methionyl-tRNA formyltransferase [Spirochaetia bacterium]|nr:methionyl-tRNA formyltransferase [Spirochaetia bacterium]
MIRILFAASPDIAVPTLETLAQEGGGDWELAGLLTNADRRKGRSGQAEPTAAGVAADRLSIARLKPEKLDGAAREAVAALKPDLLVSFAYGKLFGPKFLALFPLGGINIHPSLLPKYRGPSPIPAAILHRETETGITIQRLAPEMDTGNILLQETFPLEGRETTASLSDTVARKSAVLIKRVIRDLGLGEIEERLQNHGEATYCRLLSKEDGRIDWSLSAPEIDARIRAFSPWPLAWTKHGEEMLFILEGRPGDCPPPEGASSGSGPGTVLGISKNQGILVQTGDGVLVLERLQYQTRKALDWKAFINGARNFLQARLA